MKFMLWWWAWIKYKLEFRYYCSFKSAKKFTEMWRRQNLDWRNWKFCSNSSTPCLKRWNIFLQEAMNELRNHSSKRWRHFFFRWFEVWTKQSVFNIRLLSVCNFKRNKIKVLSIAGEFEQRGKDLPKCWNGIRIREWPANAIRRT